MIAASYRVHVEINSMCIELIRQFYDETRSFRITGDAGDYQFVDVSNEGLKDQQIMAPGGMDVLYRRPIFDVKVQAQKKNPFSRMEQNERAKELYGLGFFNPERAQEALGALDMMDFEGIDKVRDKVQQGQTLLNICQQMSQQMDQLALIIQSLTGKDMGIGMPVAESGNPPKGNVSPGSNGMAQSAVQAQQPMTDYGTRLAKRSSPDMEARG